MKRFPFWLLVGCFCLVALFACRKERIYTGAAVLGFSTDTVQFDTVFTAMGSATQVLKVFNPYDQPLVLSSIRLAGGRASDFNLNIDGVNTPEVTDLQIPANDSVYIFVNVQINPAVGDAVRMDSILFETNGSRQQVQLSAYGWNATYIGQRGYLTRFTNTNIRFTNDKPIVLFGIIAIDSGSTLTIDPGTEVYMFGGPSSRPGDRTTLYIGYQSSIQVNVGGTFSDPVEFRTHRLESDYQEIPLHHNGIYLSRYSINNKIHNAIIRNALDGIIVDSLAENGQPKLELRNVLIHTVERSGILGRQGSISAQNCAIANSNQYNLALIRGGSYDFRHCTFVNYSTSQRFQNPLVGHNDPILVFQDFEVLQDEQGNQYVITADGSAQFTNCVVHGTYREEVSIGQAQGSTAAFAYQFDHCLMKLDTFQQNLVGVIRNQDPDFENVAYFDFNPDTTSSPLIDAGISAGVATDILGRPRDANPDIGAWEYQP